MNKLYTVLHLSMYAFTPHTPHYRDKAILFDSKLTSIRIISTPGASQRGGERGEQSTRLGERWIHKVVDTYGGNVRSREGDNCVGGGTVLSWLLSDQIGSKIFPARCESGNKKCARGWGNGGTFCTRMPRCCTTWCGEKTGNQTERGNWTALKKVSQKNEVNRKI